MARDWLSLSIGLAQGMDYEQSRKFGRTRASSEQAMVCSRTSEKLIGSPLLFAEGVGSSES